MSDERVVIGFSREQVVVNRNDNTVFVDVEKMDDATCEVKNFQVVAASAEQLAAQASHSASSSELGEIQQGLEMLEEELVMLKEENEALRETMDDILDVVQYLADKNVSTGERVLEKIDNIEN